MLRSPLRFPPAGVFSEELLRKHIKTVMEDAKLKYSDDMPLHIISFLRNDSKVGPKVTPSIPPLLWLHNMGELSYKGSTTIPLLHVKK